MQDENNNPCPSDPRAGINRGPRPRFAAGDVIFVSPAPAPGKPYVIAGDRPGIAPGLQPRWEPRIGRGLSPVYGPGGSRGSTGRSRKS